MIKWETLRHFAKKTKQIWARLRNSAGASYWLGLILPGLLLAAPEKTQLKPSNTQKLWGLLVSKLLDPATGRVARRAEPNRVLRASGPPGAGGHLTHRFLRTFNPSPSQSQCPAS